MKHSDYTHLLEKAGVEKNQIWADLGSGEGAFTMALADLGNEAITIYSIDKDVNRLETQKDLFHAQFPHTVVHYMDTDFTKVMALPPLDGLLMANSLHFIKDKKPLLRNLATYLKPNGRFVLIEYDVDVGNYWVPYPVSYNTFFFMVEDIGLSKPQLLEIVPSRFLDGMYSALCFRIT